MCTLDTSASMNQRTCLQEHGAKPTLLDVAKDAVEKFIKIRQRDAASRFDRYMLLTFEEPPRNIKAGWKENLATFMTELKNLQSLGMTTMGAALKNAFDLLNINRMQTGIDTYGQGRCPYYLEPSIIILITDGGRLISTQDVEDELNLPMHSSILGSELTKEPFRWDQRLFSLSFRLSGTPATKREPSTVILPDNSAVDAMCEVTGGRSYAITSQHMLIQCLESVAQKIQTGVVIHFEKTGPDPPPVSIKNMSCEEKNGWSKPSVNMVNNTLWHSCRKLIYVPRSAQKGYMIGHWPIPESFWPDQSSPSLPHRTAHPVVNFSCRNSEPMVIDNLPFDKYELEPSPLTQYILSRNQPTVAWQVFVRNSYKSSEVDYPFGYLKASTSLTCVNLFVMPYNYPVLLPLLDELFKVHKCKPTREWKEEFDNYLKNMPLYYSSPLKKALQRMGATPNLVPEAMENCLNYTVSKYLERSKIQAKTEFEKLIASVNTEKTVPESMQFRLSALVTKFLEQDLAINDSSTFSLPVKGKKIKKEYYRNSSDIHRRKLLDQLARMRSNFLQSNLCNIRLQNENQIHSLPVAQMGNYQDYLKRITPPLREVEPTPLRQHTFGNPFKINKRIIVDIDLVGGGGRDCLPMQGQKQALEMPVGSQKSKRKPGPLPKDFFWKPHSSSLLNQPFLDVMPHVQVLTPSSLIENDKDLFLEEENKPCQPLARNNVPIIENMFSFNNIAEQVNTLNHVNSHNSVNHINECINEEALNNGSAPNSYDFENSLQVLNGFRTDVIRIRTSLFKEIRKPGRKCSRLFEQLQLVEGNNLQIHMVHELINEASRFKRKKLIKLLKDYERTLLSTNRVIYAEAPIYSR